MPWRLSWHSVNSGQIIAKQVSMKDAEEYIQYCRYYCGEESCPESMKQLSSGESLWFYEMKWVQFNLEGEDLQWALDDYNAYGMSDFSTDDGVPLSLKALLFNRYYKGGYIEVGGGSFRGWYKRTYLSFQRTWHR